MVLRVNNQPVTQEQSLSFLEFNYMILQAYDFRELSQRHGVRLQMGGSDQWGNIIMGVELNRRADAAGQDDEVGVEDVGDHRQPLTE